MTELRNRIGCMEVYDGPGAESLAVVLCSYFDTHPDRPDDDPLTDNGFGEWSETMADKVLDDLTERFFCARPADTRQFVGSGRLLERETRIKHLEWLLCLAIKHVRKHEKIAHALDDLFEARELDALCEVSELQHKINEALGHD